jgi:vacuole morphology and inheritance protein 14
MTKDFVSVQNHGQIRKLLKVLGSDFALSQNPNMRKGGLIGLAAMAIALGKETQTYTEDLVRPVLTCLSDTDSRVRYYACESLYNVIKVSRENTVPIFNDIFNAMGAVITDRDQSVRTGAELLDRLLKVRSPRPFFEQLSFALFLLGHRHGEHTVQSCQLCANIERAHV